MFEEGVTAVWPRTQVALRRSIHIDIRDQKYCYGVASQAFLSVYRSSLAMARVYTVQVLLYLLLIAGTLAASSK
jgi:hypothetical protein